VQLGLLKVVVSLFHEGQTLVQCSAHVLEPADMSVHIDDRHRVIAAAANCTEATLNRILKGRVHTCKLDTLEAIATALGYQVRLVKNDD
jgi:DNA-binding Xre family transcriptional regulator